MRKVSLYDGRRVNERVNEERVYCYIVNKMINESINEDEY
jgi:hypothetical protein